MHPISRMMQTKIVGPLKIQKNWLVGKNGTVTGTILLWLVVVDVLALVLMGFSQFRSMSSKETSVRVKDKRRMSVLCLNFISSEGLCIIYLFVRINCGFLSF